MEKTVENAKKMAMDNYETWGHWVVECYTNDELQEELDEFDTLKSWINIRISVADARKEIEDTAW